MKYRVDFPALMRLCEGNYAKLIGLVPRQQEVGAQCHYQVVQNHYRLTIEETTKYTTLIQIEQMDSQPGFLLSQLQVRLYHDARVAEVCTSQQHGKPQPRYDYPNQKMYQQDEKHRVNHFLSEWLTFCLQHGIHQQPLMEW
ncbi:hypothetical protein VST7929_02320 [Vibrio stylophorae]|uniref:Dehydrogenase n=1 Tax=Vibrio stylophorae TaxID=659351 RepID=A0ABM8ZVM8_9VIBR|nr:DUF1249 family protein [Vibrio stylophorae]CAH0534389.1 hypothetical protein VST7929_02320 [Vibrio stylophorae]